MTYAEDRSFYEEMRRPLFEEDDNPRRSLFDTPPLPPREAKGGEPPLKPSAASTPTPTSRRTPDDVEGAAFANLLIDSEFDGQFARFDTDVDGMGLPWAKRDKASASVYMDRSSIALLSYLADTLHVSRGAVVQALLAWFGSFCMDDTHELRQELAEPRARQMLLGALEGQIPFPHRDDEATSLISREQLLEEWICFWEYLWSKEFYKEHATYSSALTPEHFGMLKRLSQLKGKTPAELLGEIIEALASRDLGIDPSESE
jgi:hypothetical protein